MYEIPADRLPPGFAETVEDPVTAPAVAAPAATVVLVRDGSAGLEVLLLKRHRASGFVPGAYVFPGGRVDDEDGDAALAEFVRPIPSVPVLAYWIAAVREAFEETGILLARDECGGDAPGEQLSGWREDLLQGVASLLLMLRTEKLQVTLHDMAYCAHWITPVAEPRRYDTHFFLARIGRQEVTIDAREMTDFVWLAPADALQRFAQGSLPMVFPTVKTLEQLTEFHSAAEALSAFRARPVTAVLPKLVRTPTGVGIVVKQEQEKDAPRDSR